MLSQIALSLKQAGGYHVLKISFEGLTREHFKKEAGFCKGFVKLVDRYLLFNKEEELHQTLVQEGQKVLNLGGLDNIITTLTLSTQKRIVLLIDEVDKSSNNDLFLDFLGILRSKYLNSMEGNDKTFHSVILVGVTDIKTLKQKIRPDIATSPNNSPWNIATAYKVDMNLQPSEILPMLEDYAQERGVVLNAPELADRLFHFTSGYPFLLSGICKIFDEDILPAKKEKQWTTADLDRAAQVFLKNPNSNTNFDHIIKYLENYPKLYQLVYDILIDGQHYDFTVQEPTMYLGISYGIFAKQSGNGMKIHNRIYAEMILNYMTAKVKLDVNMLAFSNQNDYLLPGNQLNLPAVLDRFQEFMKEQESRKDLEFLEKNGTLLFLGFLQPILNGGGFAFKEAQISNEKRLDVVITFFQHKYVVELKIWRGAKKHEEGLNQLAGYLDLQNLDEGYLLIFDFRMVKKSRERKWLKAKGKRVYSVWA